MDHVMQILLSEGLIRTPPTFQTRSLTRAFSIRVAFVVVLVLAAKANAGDKSKWTYTSEQGRGYFAHQAKDNWMEVHPEGYRFSFQQTEQTADYVELFDRSRGKIWVRLYSNRSTWKHPELTNGEWRDLYRGRYEIERIEWGYKNPQGAGFFRNLDGAEWVEYYPDGRRVPFTEVARNSDFIELSDRKINQIDVRLYADYSEWRHATRTKGEWSKLWEGRYRANAHERLKFTYLETDGSPAIFVARPTLWIQFASGKEHKFRLESSSSDRYVLIDDERKLAITLFKDGRIQSKTGNGSWQNLGSGKGTWGLQLFLKS